MKLMETYKGWKIYCNEELWTITREAQTIYITTTEYQKEGLFSAKEYIDYTGAMIVEGNY